MNNLTLVRPLVALAAIALSSPALAQTRHPVPPSSSQTLMMGPLIGLEFSHGDAGLALRGDASIPLTRVSGSSAHLDGVLSVGMSWFSQYNRPYDVDVDTTIFKLIPALRLSAPLTPTIGIYGDAGLGFYYGSSSVDAGFAYSGASDSGAGVGMRFAGGLFADVSPRVRLGGEFGVNPYFGHFDETTVSLLFSAMFRF